MKKLQKTLAAAQAHHQAGRLDQAEALYRTIVAGRPNDPRVLFLLGLAAHQRGAQEEAEDWIRRAIAASGHPVAELSNTLGAILGARGRTAEAIRCFEEAIALRPDYTEARQNLCKCCCTLGTVYTERKMRAEATAYFRLALDMNPRYAAAWNNLGVMLKTDPNHEQEAEAYFEKAVELDPSHADAWNNLGNIRRAQDRTAEAIECVQKAIALRPGFGAAYSNLSVMLHEQGKLTEAIAALERALEIQPRDSASWSNLGNYRKEECRFTEAKACYDKAAELDPESTRARWNRSLILFVTGEIARGWEEYDIGWADGQRKPQRPFAQPQWDGSPLAGRKLLFWGEQGIGDQIILANMIPDLGAGHIVECEPRLVPLFARSFPEVEVVPRTDPPHPATAQADLQIPAGSAGRWLRASLDRFPRHRGYLRPDPERVAYWRREVAALGDGVKAGICWRSGMIGGLRRLHATELKQWGEVLAVPGVRFVNLQYDDCAAELEDAMARFGVEIHAMPGIDLKQDLDDAAALTAALDLVISVATSVADMAGALGKPIWMPSLASQGNWYTMGQSFVPWFPSTRRYTRMWDQPWEDILRRVAADLAGLARS
ncbi:MAG TPA: tetratricopeptide repeat protein [Bryobacteraceae bacterium]|nr:tetratricopeptide repeat protein [Bryobacteraceae bacterium]